MSSFSVDETLLIRALNSTRQGYWPTYIGLRLVASQLPPSSNSYLRRSIERRLLAGDEWIFRPFDYFKGMRAGAAHIPDYRPCHAPGAFTALAESYILYRLAGAPAFLPHWRAFSYLWPKSNKTGASYAFFAEGYKRRNREIAAALDAPSAVAVVVDIRAFYPSADTTQLKNELRKRIRGPGGVPGPIGAAIESFYEQLLKIGPSGIPIGPSSGHVLGHLAMTGIDAELAAEYGARYFRYVDDIVIVCAREVVEVTQQKISSCIINNGFSLNVDKSFTMSSEAWLVNVVQQDVAGGDDFRQFARDLSIHLAFNPGKTNDIKEKLIDAGLSIPFSRIVSCRRHLRRGR